MISLFDITLIVLVSFLIFCSLFGTFTFNFSDKRLLWLSVAFVLAQLITLLFNLKDVQRGLLAVKVFTFGYLSYLLCISLIKRYDDLQRIIFSLVVWGATVGVLLIYHYLMDWSSIIGQQASYVTKSEIGISMGRSNYLAALLVPLLPIAIAALFSVRRMQKIIVAMCVGLIVIGLAITMSKGAFGALLVGFFCALPLIFKAGFRLRHAAVCVAVLFFLLCLGELLAPDLLAFNYEMVAFRVAQPDFTRIDLWKTAWEVFLRHPFLGIGPNAIYIYNYQFVVDDLYTHNFILNSLAEMGLFGSLPFFLIVGILMRRSYRLCVSTITNPRVKHLTVGLFVSLLATLLHGLVEPTFQGQQYAVIFWTCVALIYLLHRIGPDRELPVFFSGT
jgi:O-antigen ligase